LREPFHQKENHHRHCSLSVASGITAIPAVDAIGGMDNLAVGKNESVTLRRRAALPSASVQILMFLNHAIATFKNIKILPRRKGWFFVGISESTGDLATRGCVPAGTIVKRQNKIAPQASQFFSSFADDTRRHTPTPGRGRYAYNTRR